MVTFEEEEKLTTKLSPQLIVLIHLYSRKAKPVGNSTVWKLSCMNITAVYIFLIYLATPNFLKKSFLGQERRNFFSFSNNFYALLKKEY